MDHVESLNAFNRIKLLADARRMEILRFLMASPATLTQLANSLHHTPAWVRHHLKVLEEAGLVEPAGTRTTGRVTEKFYRAHAGAFLLQQVILPKSRKPTIIFSGSHDLALEEIAEHVSRQLTLLTLPVGSLDGLVNLRQGLCQVAGAHLRDESGEYNTPYIRHLFPEGRVELITLAYRTQGLMFSPGNPQKIKRLSDLEHAEVRFVNRNPGSGTRLWLDRELNKAHLSPKGIQGYDHEVKTHTEAAILIETGKADVALGLQAAAHRHNLGFLPLFEERYDLVLPRDQEQILSPFLDYIQTADFRQTLETLTGYNSVHSGEQVSLH